MIIFNLFYTKNIFLHPYLWQNKSVTKNIPSECPYMISSVSKLCNLTNSFSSSFVELGIFKALRYANIYKRNGTEIKTIFIIIFSLCFIIFHGINLFILNIMSICLVKTVFIVFLIHVSLTGEDFFLSFLPMQLV